MAAFLFEKSGGEPGTVRREAGMLTAEQERKSTLPWLETVDLAITSTHQESV